MSELLPCPFCGGEAETLTAESMHGGYLFGIMCNDCRSRGDVYDTEAEAIDAWNSRAELGSEPPYYELLRCLENEWNIKASWDGLRKFWCIELTEEGVKLRDTMHGTLTAEQVREAIEENSWKEAFMLREFNESSWQAIADELNARAERTCECVAEYAKSPFDGKTIVLHRCSECHELMLPHMLYCPNCGARVVA